MSSPSAIRACSKRSEFGGDQNTTQERLTPPPPRQARPPYSNEVPWLGRHSTQRLRRKSPVRAPDAAEGTGRSTDATPSQAPRGREWDPFAGSCCLEVARAFRRLGMLPARPRRRSVSTMSCGVSSRFSSSLGEESRSNGHNGAAQHSKRTNMLRWPLPIQKYGTSYLVHHNHPNCTRCVPYCGLPTNAGICPSEVPKVPASWRKPGG